MGTKWLPKKAGPATKMTAAYLQSHREDPCAMVTDSAKAMFWLFLFLFEICSCKILLVCILGSLQHPTPPLKSQG